MTDPAGLDAAIDELAREWGHPEDCPCSSDEIYEDARPCSDAVDNLHLAADRLAPHIRRAVLLEAADEIKAKLRAEYAGIMWAGLTRAERMLRERAERETT